MHHYHIHNIFSLFPLPGHTHTGTLPRDAYSTLERGGVLAYKKAHLASSIADSLDSRSNYELASGFQAVSEFSVAEVEPKNNKDMGSTEKLLEDGNDKEEDSSSCSRAKEATTEITAASPAEEDAGVQQYQQPGGGRNRVDTIELATGEERNFVKNQASETEGVPGFDALLHEETPTVNVTADVIENLSASQEAPVSMMESADNHADTTDETIF